LAPDQAQSHDEKNDRYSGPGQEAAHFIQVCLQGGFARFDRLEELGDPAEFGLHTGGNNNSPAAAIGDKGASIDHVLSIADG
jgi:hypothetical protein